MNNGIDVSGMSGWIRYKTSILGKKIRIAPSNEKMRETHLKWFSHVPDP